MPNAIPSIDLVYHLAAHIQWVPDNSIVKVQYVVCHLVVRLLHKSDAFEKADIRSLVIFFVYPNAVHFLDKFPATEETPQMTGCLPGKSVFHHFALAINNLVVHTINHY